MIKFKIYKEHGALNSVDVLSAVSNGLSKMGFSVVDKGEDIPVIWSVLWNGRMMPNRQIYNNFRSKNRPVMIIEVGNLSRGITWRISLNNVNLLGYFGEGHIDESRPQKLGFDLKPYNPKRKSAVLLASQHERSLQWEGMPSMSEWVAGTVQRIRKYTDREIVVRGHPRSRINYIPLDRTVTISVPKRLIDTYDDFDIDYGYHCVINHNSGPAVQAAIDGTPVICDSSSLAWPISDSLENVESITLKDRESWFLNLCHMEWTVDEIRQGIPFDRMKKYLYDNLSG